MDLNLQTLKNLSNFNKIILMDELDNNEIKFKNNSAIVIIHKKKILNIDKLREKYKDRLFFFTFRELKKGWKLYDLIRRRSFKRYIKYYIKFVYGSRLFENSYKKYICNKLKEYQEIQDIKKLLRVYNKNIEVIVKSKNYYEVDRIFNKKKKILNINLTNMKKLVAFIFFPIYLILVNKKKLFDSAKRYDNYFRLYNNGMGVGELGNLDWLHEENKQNLFVVEDSIHKDSEHLQNLEKKKYKYTFCSNRNAVGEVSLLSIIKLSLIYFPISIPLGLYSFLFKNSSFNFFYDAWTSLLKWKLFVRMFKGGNYICYHNYEYNHIFRNIILKKNSFKTIHYKHTNSENVFYYNKSKKYINPDLYWHYYDYEFHQSKQSVEMSKENQSLSSNHIINGPTFYFRNQNISSTKYDLIFFNSTFLSFAPVNSPNSHLNFLKLIIKFSKEFNINILFKSKQSIKKYENYNIDFKNLINQIKMEKKITIIDSDIDTFNLIKNSGISIIMPFSSNFITSLAMNKKFFFIDSENEYRNSYFSKFNNLIVNTNQDSLKLFKNLQNYSDNQNYTSNLNIYKETFGKENNILVESPLHKFVNV